MISDVVNILSDSSRRLDPEKVGVNIVMGGGLAAQSTEATPAAPPSTEGTPAAPVASTNAALPRITLSLRNVPMIDALNYITTLANLKYRIESSAVLILPLDAPEPQMITRVYPISPGVFGDFVEPINFFGRPGVYEHGPGRHIVRPTTGIRTWIQRWWFLWIHGPWNRASRHAHQPSVQRY